MYYDGVVVSIEDYEYNRKPLGWHLECMIRGGTLLLSTVSTLRCTPLYIIGDYDGDRVEVVSGSLSS